MAGIDAGHTCDRPLYTRVVRRGLEPDEIGLRAHVLAAWVVSRVVGVIALVVTPTRGGEWFNTFGLTTMDGGWYRIIIDAGYTSGPLPDHATVWPFFPLYPWLADAVVAAGAPVGPTLIVVSWLAAAVALAGVGVLVRQRFGGVAPGAAALAVWMVALLPGSLGWVLSYSDSMFVAGVVWCLVFVDRIVDDRTARTESQSWDSRWLVVGLVATIATMSRPNGFLLLVALLVALLTSRAGLAEMVAAIGPSVLSLLGWMAFSNARTGDPLVFLTAKDAWLEVSPLDVITDPLERPAALFHVIVFLAVLALAFPWLRRLPLHWTVIGLLLVLPSFVLGIEGLARYTSMAVPLVVGAALALSHRPPSQRLAFLLVSSAAMIFLGVNVVRSSWVP